MSMIALKLHWANCDGYHAFRCPQSLP